MQQQALGRGRATAAPTLILVLFLSCASISSAEVEPVFDPDLYKAMEYRGIGPYRGGRVTAVTGVVSEPGTFYMGSTGGGVWKTTDAGETWRNVSDEFLTSASVGAVAVAPSDPNVVYVGTGSACPRGNVSPGDGVYRSTDAGQTWSHVGLDDAGQIGRIRVHPKTPDLVYVAALGHIFGANKQRGVFRSKDGGETWDPILFVNEIAGAVDLAMDPNNPRNLYAAIWQVVRKPWALESGGEYSGLYRSTDGGDTWDELTEGLPEGIKGRIGVTVSAARRGRVWALVEAEDGGLFRSDDGGKKFRLINADRNFRQRAWYYTHVFADPNDAETVYILNVGMWRSTDGGKSFEFIRAPHGDHHDLWIHPDDSNRMINGNDGGANVSLNAGRTWTTQANQPTAEIYRVTVDDQFPYRLYGAQQDNTTISIPSRTSSSGITRRDWYPVGGCESGHVAVDPRDPDIVYAGCYGGSITRYDHATDQEREIVVYPQLAVGQAARDLRYRFQWNAPIRLSPQDPDVIYHTSQFVLRSSDGGQSWETISPDLSRNDESKEDYSGGPLTRDNTGVEVYGTVFAFEPSPYAEGLLWAGTDDGRVHLSRDNGGSWKEITPQKMPAWAQVNTIGLSAHDPGRAFLAVTRYRLDDFKPYVFRTNDYGKSWELLTDGKNGIPENHFVRCAREDPERRGLLYAGTEFGVYVSFDDGGHWQSLQLKLPVTPITDLAVRHGDLIVSTQGRGFWILDDLSPLRQLDETVASSEHHLFEPGKTVRFGGDSSFGGGGSAGKNPPGGAIVYYTFDSEPDDEVVLEILDAEGDVLRRLSSVEEERSAPNPFEQYLPEPEEPRTIPTEAGMNRWVWDLRLADAEIVPDAILWGRARGPRVPPGTYQVRLTVGDWSQTRSFTVVKDPRLATTQEDFEAQYALSREIWEALSETHRTLAAIRDIRKQVEELTARLEKSGKGDGLAEATDEVTSKLEELAGRLYQTRNEAIQDILNYPPQIDNQLLGLFAVVDGADARPTDGAVGRFDDLRRQLDSCLADYRGILDRELAAFNDSVESKKVTPVVVP